MLRFLSITWRWLAVAIRSPCQRRLEISLLNEDRDRRLGLCGPRGGCWCGRGIKGWPIGEGPGRLEFPESALEQIRQSADLFLEALDSAILDDVVRCQYAILFIVIIVYARRPRGRNSFG